MVRVDDNLVLALAQVVDTLVEKQGGVNGGRGDGNGGQGGRR
jgi:hypothetical protein